MSTNATDTASISTLTASQSLYLIIRPSLDTLLLSYTFSLFLILLITFLFYFSTPQGRRQPIFIFNVVSIFLAFVVGVLCNGVAIHAILEPLNPWPAAASLVVGFIGVWQSILVDLTLLLRVIFVYPLAEVGVIRFSLLIATPVFLKLARVINLMLFTKVLVDAMNGPNAAVILGATFSSTPYIKIEWAAQMIDNTYASLAFLWKLHHQRKKRIVTNSSRVTLAQRMRTLFNIALTTFVVPTMFSIAQFVCVYRNVDDLVLNQIMLVNTMLSTFCVAFATVWAGTNRQGTQALDSKGHNSANSSTPIFTVRLGRSVNQSSTGTIAECGLVR